MANILTERVPYGDEKDEKQLGGSVEKFSYADSDGKVVDDAEIAREVEAFEDRLMRDDASDNEYLVQSGSDVALKVCANVHLFLQTSDRYSRCYQRGTTQSLNP